MAENSNSTPSRKKVASWGYVIRNIILPRKKLLLLGLVLIIINRLSGLVLPGSSKFLIDKVIAEKDLQMLKWLLIVVGIAVLVQAVTSFFLTQLLSVEAQSLITNLRIKIQQQVIHLPMRYFDNNKSGTIVTRIMSDVEGVRNLVGTGLVQLLGGLLTSVIALILLLRINVQLTLFAMVPLIIFGFIAMKAFTYIRPIFRERNKIQGEVTGRLTESLGGIRVVKGFHAEEQEINIFSQGVDRLFQNVKKTLLSTSFIASAATLLLGVASIGIMAIGGHEIIAEKMTVGDFFAYTLYLGFLVAPIIQMSNIGTQITEAFAGLDRMEEVLNLEREGEEPNRTVAVKEVNGHIKFHDVHFSYEAGKDVLHNISFDVPAGTVTALVGSSGSGKTTIAGLAASFLKPTAGHITVDDIDLSTLTLHSYRSQLGVVLQDDFLFEGTIRENILFSNPAASEEQLMQAVAAAHVKEFIDRFDDGIDTLIGERGVKLSGGQRQRIAIARALLADPKILILDEATSNLDTESELYIQQSLQHLMKGRTTLVIAHRLSTIRKADQILVLEQGEIRERGTHEELIGHEGRYYQLYTYQARI